ncbi:MAG: hypothetical protein HQ526_07480 [Actinobacteria bacterium]|nr:hypothetical protein [Actinomycetota bacterium]
MKSTSGPRTGSATLGPTSQLASRTVRAICVGLVVALALTLAGPVSPARADGAKPLADCTAEAQAAGLETEGEELASVAPITDFLVDAFKKAESGAKVAGFIFSILKFTGLVPDPTKEKLDEISNQLKAMEKQIEGLKNELDSLQRALQELKIDVSLTKVNEAYAEVLTLYTTYFMPTVSCAKLVAATKPNTPERAAAQAKLDQAKNEFKDAYDNSPAKSAALELQAYLVPGSLSLVSARGLLLLMGEDTRYLTAEHSREIRETYQGVANIQAMAQWMTAERFVEDGKQQFQLAYDNYIGSKDKAGWLPTQVKNLPPIIPDDVVVDLGPKSILDTGGPKETQITNDAKSWLPGTSGELLSQPKTSGPDHVDSNLKAMNDAKLGDSDKWAVPDQATLTAFYSGARGYNASVGHPLASVMDKETLNAWLKNGHSAKASAATFGDWLSSRNTPSKSWERISGTQPNDSSGDTDAWPHLFSSQVYNQKIHCYTQLIVHYNVHDGYYPTYSGVSTRAPAWSLIPTMPPDVGSASYTSKDKVIAACNEAAAWSFKQTSNRGGYLAYHPVTPTYVDFMGQVDDRLSPPP